MGSRGITMRESDYGMDLLDLLILQQLKKTDFATFNVSEAIELLRQDILEVIGKENQGCLPEDMSLYIEANFPQDFTQAQLLIAECLSDYYHAGEFVIYDYVGENYDQIEHRIIEFVVTEADLQLLLGELQNVQNPEHWLYQS